LKKFNHEATKSTKRGKEDYYSENFTFLQFSIELIESVFKSQMFSTQRFKGSKVQRKKNP
jgi:hypothetical protein